MFRGCKTKQWQKRNPCVHGMNLQQDLLSIGSQLKGILEPVEQFVGKLADILTTRRPSTAEKQTLQMSKQIGQPQRM